MISLLTSCELFLRLGLVYSILAMGYYVSYTILDFPDLTVEGTFLGGAVMCGIFVSHGISGWLGIIAAFAVGGLFGALTGVLNVKLKVRPCFAAFWYRPPSSRSTSWRRLRVLPPQRDGSTSAVSFSQR